MSRRPTRRRGVLLIVAGLFVASGVVRVTFAAGPATAQAPMVDIEPVAATPVSVTDAEIKQLLDALSAREQRITDREEALADRLQALEVADAQIAARLEELRAAEDALAQTVASTATAAQQDIAALTIVYENMKPANAAALFAAMTPDFAAGFLTRMRPEIAADILAGLEPDAAYAISVTMAGRNATAPTE